jgi:hypothetical protein
MPYKIDFDFSKAGYFIDCDTFINDGLVVEFLELVVNQNTFESKGKIESLSIAQSKILRQFKDIAKRYVAWNTTVSASGKLQRDR